jgi:hypothetical protein
MQNGSTPAYIASLNGNTETLALLLANKADINAAIKVQQFKIIKYLLFFLTTNLKTLTLLFSYYRRFQHELLFNMVHVSIVCRTVLPQRI